jgi:type I restriction enzyme S subunit
MDTKKLRQKILDLAIHGKLVPQDPTDEPASVLLERIKAEKERLIKEGKIKRSKKSAKTSDTPHYENVPFEIPNNWVWTTLGEISNYGDSNNVSVTDIADDEWILELEDLEKDTASIIQILSKKERSIKGVRHKFKKGDVLYSKLRTYLNKVLVAPQIGYCTTEIIPFNSYCGISTHYLCHVLRSAYFLDYTQQCGYGVKMPRLSTNDACKGMIPLPPLAEQHRIVAEIEKWFSLIDIIENGKSDLQTTIKQTKSKILDLAIHGKLISQDLNDEPAIELLKRINPDYTPCDNGHYTQLPEGWAICKMKQITSITNGKSQKNVETLNGIYPIYGSGGVIGRANQYLCIAGSTIIGRKGTINNPIFVEEHFWNVDTAFGLKANDAILDKYLYYFCLSFDFSKLDKSTAMPSLTKTSIGNVLIPIPPYKEQERIVAKIDMVLDTMNEILRAV